MKPVMQTEFGKDDNSFQASMASLLEIPLAMVPIKNSTQGWRAAVDVWLFNRGLLYVDLAMPEDIVLEMRRFFGFHTITGTDPKGVRRTLVGFKGEICFDPHPEEIGVNGAPHELEYGLFVLLDPVRWPHPASVKIGEDNFQYGSYWKG